MSAPELAQIQGLVLYGYKHHPHARHFVVSVAGPAAARKMLGSLVTGLPQSGLRITTSARWTVRPDYTLNVSATFDGLTALGLPPTDLGNFPSEFQAGALGRAEAIFDTGDSAPDRWLGGMNQGSKVHLIFSLFAVNAAVRDQRSAQLRAAFSPALVENYSHDGDNLPGGYVHFGFKDGISQPKIQGVPSKGLPYPLPDNPAGDFVLGYPNFFGFKYSPDLAASPLGMNGGFGAFRILEQDIAGFNQYLNATAPGLGLTPDKLAAKFMGRWRSGVPLTLSPDSDCPVAPDRMNQFLFQGLAPGQSQPDPKGFGCPAGSHIRRGNPRDDKIAGGFTQQARVLRHNLPYGPPLDPTHPYASTRSTDGKPRGLIGYFQGSSFSAQFELLMRFWVNTAGFTPGIQGRDPIMGANDPAKSRFVLPTSPPPSPTVKGFERFVNTRGSAYCFFPSVAGLQYIAAL